MSVSKTSINVKTLKVISLRHLNDSTFVVRFEKGDMEYLPGQYLALGVKGKIQKREYSIYSRMDADYLEILVKEVLDGDVSIRLKDLKPGDELEVQGPFGYFTMDEKLMDKKIVFISSGTGISPCHSMVRSYKELDFTILHGIKSVDEQYEKEHYAAGKYIACTSRDEGGDFKGRVTDYLKKNKADKNAEYYLCGNSNMIYDVFDLLKDAKVPQDQIHTEVYF